jgi:hypothetical protein
MEIGFRDTIRVFWLESDQIDDYKMFSGSLSCGNLGDLTETEWIWYNAANIFFGDELIYIRKALVEKLVRYYQLCIVDAELITQLLIKLLDDEMLYHYQGGTWDLLAYLFDPYIFTNSLSLDSDSVGGAYLDLLQRLGLDVETCVSSQLERFPNGVMETWYEPRKVIFEPHAIRGWILRWEWIYDPSEPAYLVLSEYNALPGDANTLYLCWPFTQEIVGVSAEESARIDANLTARFARRIAAKARKDRARTGQKRQRGKMPGAWA